MKVNEIKALIRKDIITEWRQKYALSGILLHVVSMIFIVFLSLKIMNAPTWNTIFWLIILFSSVSAVAKSFIGESNGQHLYYYTISSPQSIIIAKLIYNSVLMFLQMAVSMLVYFTLLGNIAEHSFMYIICLALGGWGFAITFTFLSAISAKASNSNGLMPVLSFPLILPILLIAVKASKKAMDGIDVSLMTKDLLMLFVFNILLITMSYILFPFLWKD
jgi:heme exporter protein B